MRKMMAFVLLAATTPAAGQDYTIVRPVPMSCGTVCGASTGTVLRTTAGTVAGVNVVTGATAGFAVLYDASSIPADGALAPNLVRWCLPVAANTGSYTPLTPPVQVYSGLVFFVSSSSCTNKVAVTYGYVGAQVRQ